jgi:hypothetical protein
MKRKIFTLVIVSALMLSAASVQAQDRRYDNTELQQDHQAIKERYEQRKQAIHDAYKRDMEALGAKSGLSALERKEQRRIIQERFNQQKKELQAAYKADKKALQAKRKSDHELEREDDVKAGKDLKKEKADKASRRNERSYEKGQNGQGKGKGQAMSQGKGKGKRS